MTTVTIQPASTADDERHLWMPPRRLRDYARARVLGAVLFSLIFVGWLIIQWSNPVMRYGSIALILITAWVTAASILNDVRRARARQVALIATEPAMLEITTPQGTSRVGLETIVRAVWREHSMEEMGLWLYGSEGAVLSRLDGDTIVDQAEARVFLRWLRERAAVNFEVSWPQVG
ncbi:MAG: hypothetical protein WD768_15585 [Phycisphaeraceae bacterium]